MRNKYLLIFLTFFFSLNLYAQSYTAGAILDPDSYNQTKLKPILISRNYQTLPRSVSLKQYSPIPENQGIYKTSVAWATAYTARTISESITLKRTNKKQISENVYSPYFVYVGHYQEMGITQENFPDFLNNGSIIPLVLKYMKNEGAVKRPSFEKTTDFKNILFSSYSDFKRYPISDFVKLFMNPRSTSGTIEERVIPVKKSLSESKPVIIGMNTPVTENSSFRNAKDVWLPNEDPSVDYGGLALCVVGYDDNKHGGAFEIQNSWGTEWGNNGYLWIKYDDFAKYVNHAYEIIENLALSKDATRYAASIEINVFNDNRGMPVTYDKQGFYKTRYSYPNGTIFQFKMTNKYPAYVYAFSADSNTSEIVCIFPEEGVSPILDYSDSTVAWPDEHTGMELDGNADTHYLVVLYSKQALDISSIVQKFANEKGSFSERVANAVGQDFIPYNDVKYTNDKIDFSAVSKNLKSVFGLLLAIDHQ